MLQNPNLLATEFFAELSERKKISVRIIPNAKKNEFVERMQNGVWKIRIAAPARENKANIRLTEFLSTIQKNPVQIIHGTKSREKTISIQENS